MAEKSLDLSELQEQQEQYGKIETHEVHTINDVDDAMHEIAELQTKRDGISQRAERQIHKVTDWREAQYHSIDSRVDFLQREIVAVYLNNDMAGKLSTPYGSMSKRHTAEQPDWQDEAAVIKHFEDEGHDDLIKTKKSLDKTKAKKVIRPAGNVYVDEDGQVVEGIGVKPAKDTVSFKTEVDD